MQTIIITTINSARMKAFGVIQEKISSINKSGGENWKLIVIGDRKTPGDFALTCGSYINYQDQLCGRYSYLAGLLPTDHYSRKNIGYLYGRNSSWIIDTDDDNIPINSFWHDRKLLQVSTKINSEDGCANWINPYSYFKKNPMDTIWPRGYPLNLVRNTLSSTASHPNIIGQTEYAPIQQGLANNNPDVDAVYRLLFDLPYNFTDMDSALSLLGVYTPFNSQNTSFHRSVFPLLYLPSSCSFRMTDIYRSYIACRILRECRVELLFTNASVFQERNEHSLLGDFKQECEGQALVHDFIEILEKTEVCSSIRDASKSLVAVYQALIENGIFESRESVMLEAYLEALVT